MTQISRQSGQPRRPSSGAGARRGGAAARSSCRRPRSAASRRHADKQQIEFARQTLLIRELLPTSRRKNPVTDAESRPSTTSSRGQASGTEYRARHILVEKEDEAKGADRQIKGGAKFEDWRRRTPGSGLRRERRRPRLRLARRLRAEFSQAMVKLKKGEMTDAPVKSQFGWHIIKLEDTREAKFPPLRRGQGPDPAEARPAEDRRVPRRDPRQGQDRLQVQHAELIEPRRAPRRFGIASAPGR